MWGRGALIVVLMAITVGAKPEAASEYPDFEFIVPGGIAMPMGAVRVGETPADEGAVRQLVGRWLLTDYPTGRQGIEPAGPVTIDLTAQSRFELGEAQSFEFRWWGVCFGFAGTYVAEGTAINLASTIPTERTCGPKATVVEPSIVTLLERVDSWERIGDATVVLRASDAAGATLRRPQAAEPAQADDADTAAIQVQLPDPTGFLMRAAEQDAADAERAPTEVAWVAWEVGTGDRATDGVAWEAARFASRDAYRPDRVLEVEYQLTRIRTDGGLERSPCVVAGLNSTSGARPATVRRVEYAGLHLFVQEEDSSGGATGHFGETVGVMMAECGSRAGVFELGVARNVGHEWNRVSHAGGFDVPVVVAGPATHRGADPGVVELRNVTSNSFDIRFHEWDYLDGSHPLGEDIPFLMVEAGVTVLPSGAVIEAGMTMVDSAYSNIEFSAAFETTPAIFTARVR